MKGLYRGMCCGFRTHTRRPRRFFPKLFLIVTPLEFYSSARLQSVLLTCLISFCLHRRLHTHTKTESPHGAVCSLYFRTSYWQDLSKVLNPGRAVESHTFTGKTTSFAREEESTSLCCKLSGIKCHSTL